VEPRTLIRSDPPAPSGRPHRNDRVGGFDGLSEDVYDDIAAVLIEAAERLEKSTEGST
jgi:hypothetical protein